MGSRGLESTRVWKAMLAVAFALVACSLLASSAAAKPGDAKKGAAAKPVAAGRLDPGFGKGGKTLLGFPPENAGEVGVKYTLPFQFSAGRLVMAPAPGLKTVVAGSTRIERVLANGKLDRGFGAGGIVTVERPAGMTFVLADVAVDSQSRVLLAGTARPQPTSSTPDPLLSSATVMRFNADGTVDRSFAGGGVLVTDLGIKPPLVPTGRYSGASVGLRSMTVDSQDRPILAGAAVTKVSSCSRSGALSSGFVARLTSAGSPDSSFGVGGLREISDLASFDEPSLLPSGGVLTVGAGKPRCEDEGGGPAVVLTQFGPEGSLSPNFGLAGFRSLGLGSAPVATTVTPGNKILLLGAKNGKSQLVMRLTPSGGLDASFGRTGRVNVISPKTVAFTAIGFDDEERVLLGGHATKRLKGKHNKGVPRSSFVLSRMKAKGTFDRSFGRRGAVRTGFGGPSSAFATQLYVDAKGRIVVGGNVTSGLLGTGGGFALARYLAGP
jgi:uncharacterized delta-60 repeat protein